MPSPLRCGKSHCGGSRRRYREPGHDDVAVGALKLCLQSEAVRGHELEHYAQLFRQDVYLMILLVTVALNWETDVNAIIAYASRAFALFYMLQCVVAFIVARQLRDLPGRRLRLATFGFLALVCLAVFALGLPSE